MDLKPLEDLGLTKAESKTYLSLLETGTSKVGPIIEKTGLVSSAVHNAINSLTEKGLATHIKIGKIKHYKAINPEHLIKYAEEKKNAIKEILPELKLKEQLSKDKQEAEIFKGKKGIFAMMNELIEEAEKNTEYFWFATHQEGEDEEIQKFLFKYDKNIDYKGVKLKGLAPKRLKKIMKKIDTIGEIRYANFPIPAGINIYKNKVAIFSWGEKPVGYLIKSKQIAKTYISLFKDIWNMCETS
jgi:sugar-specific transcriptional regulator TrmB